MKIATIINAHGNTELTKDTIDAAKTWVSDDILVIIDGASWENWGKDLEIPAYKLDGFYHNVPKSPYRNITLALMQASQQWPDADWYCYSEYDVLFTSSSFKEDLKEAEKRGVWCIGNDLRSGYFQFPLLESMLKIKLEESKYLLGCCIFHHKDFINKLKSINFFEKFLNWTNAFSQGYFPHYEEQGGYDLAEHLYPTLANYYGGKIEEFATWHQKFGVWDGNFKKYPMRWKPDLNAENEYFEEAAIMHPIKDPDNLIRKYQQIKRRKLKKGNNVQPIEQRNHSSISSRCFFKTSKID